MEITQIIEIILLVAFGILIGMLVTAYAISLEDEINVFGQHRFVRVDAEPVEEVVDNLVGQRVCASVDSEFEYYTNGGGIRCTKYIGITGVEVEYIFQPLENWKGAYVFDTIFFGLPNQCHIPSGECN